MSEYERGGGGSKCSLKLPPTTLVRSSRPDLGKNSVFSGAGAPSLGLGMEEKDEIGL